MNFSNIKPGVITPEQALTLSDSRKLDYFRQVRIKHPRINEALADLKTMVLPGSGTDIVNLIGPTGVGKSTLSLSIKEQIIKINKDEILNDISFIPVVLMDAPASGEKSFSWRIFYIKLGLELNEPLMDKKQELRLQDGRITMRHLSHGSTVAGLRMSIEGALRYRRTILVIIDEAVHLMRHANDNTLASHMDALKSLASICGVTLALIGSYDLYQLMCLSGQLARRSAIIHFQRYRSDNDKDVKEFKMVIKSMQKYIPLAGLPDLTYLSDELMTSCIGCVGILKDTLQRALTFALNNKGIWSDKCLEKALLSEKQICSILEEVLIGENSIEKAVSGSGTLKLKAK